MNILIISGSVRTGRQTHKVAVELGNQLIEAGYQHTKVLDIAAYNLPVAEEQFGKIQQPVPGIEIIQQALHGADAMVFVSPEYHGSFSGALKNFLDYFSTEFFRKPIGVASVSTGRMGGINASSEMQQLVLSLGAFPMPVKLIVPLVHNAFAEDDTLKEDFQKAGFKRFVHEFGWFASAIAEKKKRDLNKDSK